jgi:hypothetical protein
MNLNLYLDFELDLKHICFRRKEGRGGGVRSEPKILKNTSQAGRKNIRKLYFVHKKILMKFIQNFAFFREPSGKRNGFKLDFWQIF